MRKMTDTEIDAFLMEGTRTGKLATVREDGRPHVAPIWFVTDGEDLLFNTQADSVKGRNLIRDPRVALSVDDERPPYAFVVVEGSVTFSDDQDPEAVAEKLRWATAIGGRYMGQERAEEFGRRNAVSGEYLVRLTPTSRVGKADIAG